MSDNNSGRREQQKVSYQSFSSKQKYQNFPHSDVSILTLALKEKERDQKTGECGRTSMPIDRKSNKVTKLIWFGPWQSIVINLYRSRSQKKWWKTSGRIKNAYYAILPSQSGIHVGDLSNWSNMSELAATVISRRNLIGSSSRAQPGHRTPSRIRPPKSAERYQLLKAKRRSSSFYRRKVKVFLFPHLSQCIVWSEFHFGEKW